MAINLGIIGVSGRTLSDEKLLLNNHFDWMKEIVEIFCEDVLSCNDITLISGGSAWCDHVAVSMFLTGNYPKLILYLPTDFDMDKKCFTNTYEGIILNNLHDKFSKKIKIDTLQEIYECINHINCEVVVKKGFYARNELIATNIHHIIAFSFGDVPKGGTLNTWKKINHNKKTHFNLNWI
ncbi:hypothetical protein QLL95_gp1108 [Cotonvirus japonicus]|uniref:DUF1273 domain-containing protein n=1 Tax=Cotonvirus japonicus TaxID=2811091 RepID=A0ABM7NS77_9VIRU|nr:hypothetical protein QLL95_gp1108 [Cotonvirus japonicus]BCS83015.1 hypothetical protein [Cotonvirus japonicus]